MRVTIVPVVVLSSLLAACSGTRPTSLLNCAVLGAAAGGASGAAIGAGVEDHDEETNAGIGAGAGIVLGAIAGYTICAMMPETVPPPAAAPPVTKPEPVVKKTVVLPGVQFAFDRADLGAAAKETLDREIATELSANSALTVRVEGHTDALGSDAYNQSLSQRRAESVKKYLVDKGISSSRIEAKGLGESMPVASNDTAEGREQNRRVEIKVLE
jgi:outer membrane protein OmpA-like peptidoglycan-associated protein